MKELTKAELDRQDVVDNLIHQLINDLSPDMPSRLRQEIEWNMSIIGEVRLLIQEYIVDELKLCTEQEFHPYIQEETK